MEDSTQKLTPGIDVLVTRVSVSECRDVQVPTDPLRVDCAVDAARASVGDESAVGLEGVSFQSVGAPPSLRYRG